MAEENFYDPKTDARYGKPFVDAEEWREKPVGHRYVHGGFQGTQVRFSFYFPQKSDYKGRFYHLVTPVQGSENASQECTGEEDNIGFSVSHGAYFVESNMGGDDPDPTVLFKSSAATAQYSREVAKQLFGEHHPYGYIFGGSGGGFKTIACVQNTCGIWEGSVPFVIGSPMSIPNMFTVRVHAMRILRQKLPEIIDALEPGSGRAVDEGLNEEEREALEEVTKMGFPPRTWFAHQQIGAGALPVLIYAVNQMDPNYYEDFWTKPGYLGADPTASVHRDRFRLKTRVASVKLPQAQYHTGDMGVDGAWQTLACRYETSPVVCIGDTPGDPPYKEGIKLIFRSGGAAGLSLPVEKIEGREVTVGNAFGMGDIVPLLQKVQPEDEVLLDNSDYLALQTYHRHQTPGKEYCGWDQFRDKNGEPIYPQREVVVGPTVAYTGAGSVQNGKFSGKMIVVASLMDESAFPWQADWYKQRVIGERGEKTGEAFRLWYNDNAMHGGDYDSTASSHIVHYRYALNQALLDVALWAEQGIAPPADTRYTISEGQVEVKAGAEERRGIQPLVSLKVRGGDVARVRVGEPVAFAGTAQVPPGAGGICGAVFFFTGEESKGETAAVQRVAGINSTVEIQGQHSFEKPGTYFPVLRVASCRQGAEEDPYTTVMNLARVRVIVEEQQGN